MADEGFARIAEAHQVASRPPRRADFVHVVMPGGKHHTAEVQDDVGHDMVLRHYALENVPGTTYGALRFAMSKEPESWHWPGGYGCE